MFGYGASPTPPPPAINEAKEAEIQPKLPDMTFINYLLRRLSIFGKEVYVDIKSGVFTHHLKRATAVRDGLKAYDNNTDRLNLVYNQLELIGTKDVPAHEAPKTSDANPAYIHPYWIDAKNIKNKPSPEKLEESGYYKELMKIRLGLEQCLNEATRQNKM